MKTKVLFVCIHNSARSQMAEEMLRKLGGEDFFTESAGIEPGQLNPIVVKVLQEEGINIAGKKTQAVADLIQEKRQYDYVITVCDETSAERCPMFPGKHQRIHWSFTDPSQFVGTDEEKMEKVRVVKGEIEAKLKSWLTSLAK